MSTPEAPPEPDVVALRPAEHPHPGKRAAGRTRRRLVVLLLVLLAGGGGLVGVGVLTGFLPNPVVAGDPKADGREEPPARSGPQTVKAIRPKQDPSVQLTVEQLGTVEAYYRADLRARASGLVRAVHKEIGDQVSRGDLLVEIDVPDLTQEVAQKDAVVAQRRQELRVSQAHLKDAQAGRDVMRAAIREKQALVAQAEATRDFRKKRLDRLRKLAASDAVVAGVIDEEERDYVASEAAVAAAVATVERGRADAAEAESRIEAATADTDLKAALVEVARRDLARAQAVAEYARVTAPFDGVVVRRTVDPGSFVQNATTGASDPLISVARTDLVTVVARFTDAAAPFVTEGTEAEITFKSLPGVSVVGRVTRFSPSIQNSDRTMRVEVDLFNGTAADHKRIMARLIAAGLAPLGTSSPVAAVAARQAARDTLTGLHKGDGDLFAAASLSASASQPAGRLIPGMTGTMKLLLRHFPGGYVVPSTAVYSRSGTPYVLLVEDGVTKQYPVQVQVNDGRVAKVVFVTRRRDAAGVAHEVVSELTGREVVVAGRQLEVGEGVAVRPAVTDW
ncbi:MAG: efflux RND transporter periplasmic adaptor subunit [Gemmataceae bacterium]